MESSRVLELESDSEERRKASPPKALALVLESLFVPGRTLQLWLSYTIKRFIDAEALNMDHHQGSSEGYRAQLGTWSESRMPTV